MRNQDKSTGMELLRFSGSDQPHVTGELRRLVTRAVAQAKPCGAT